MTRDEELLAIPVPLVAGEDKYKPEDPSAEPTSSADVAAVTKPRRLKKAADAIEDLFWQLSRCIAPGSRVQASRLIVTGSNSSAARGLAGFRDCLHEHPALVLLQVAAHGLC